MRWSGVYPKWGRTFIESRDFSESHSLMHELAQFKVSVSHMCYAGTVVASLSLTQEVSDLSPFTDK